MIQQDPAASQDLKELTLAEALRLADERHPALAVVRGRIEAAEGRMVQAGLLPNPEMVARMESAPFKGGMTSEADFIVGASQRLPIGGRLDAASRVEALDRDRLVREAEVLRLGIHARVHAAFATALYAVRTARLHEETRRFAQDGAEIARARLAAGDALAEDVDRVELEEIRARVEVARSRGLEVLALSGLAGAIGEAGFRIESVSGELESALEIPTLDSILAALERGPHAALGEAEIAVARERVELAKAQRIPDVNLDLFYRRVGSLDRSALDVGLAVAIPLFDRNQGRIREALAETGAAEAQVRSTRNELRTQVREAHANLARAMIQARLLKDEVLPRAARILEAAEKRHAAGDLALSEVLLMRRDRSAVRLAHLESLRDVLAAWTLLKPLALGPK